MSAFLCFTLWAPLASFGDVAVGEHRLSLERPGRSAVLGLLAAALGIERRDQAALDQLARNLLIAVRSLAAGTLLEDFHSAQVPRARRGLRHATRRDELAAVTPRDDAILSRRDYRQEPWHEVVVTLAEGGDLDLERLARALRAPCFTLYSGRKSCPLGLPPDPHLVESADLGTALADYEGRAVARRLLGQVRGATDTVHADIELRPLLGRHWRVDRILERRDTPMDRRRWQFALRRELVAVPGAQP